MLSIEPSLCFAVANSFCNYIYILPSVLPCTLSEYNFSWKLAIGLNSLTTDPTEEENCKTAFAVAISLNYLFFSATTAEYIPERWRYDVIALEYEL